MTILIPKANEAAVLTSSLSDENASKRMVFNSGMLLKSLVREENSLIKLNNN